MRKSKIILLVRLSLLCFLLNSICVESWTQDVKEVVVFANDQFLQKDYSSAVKEYQRALLFCDNAEREYISYNLAETYLASGDYYKASQTYDLAYTICKDDSVRNEIIIRKIIAFQLDQKFDLALNELLNLKGTPSPAFERRKNLYLAISFYGKEDFGSAKDHFIASIDPSNVEDRKQIDRIFCRKRNLYYPRPKLARYMSIIIPGSGQLYAGDIKNGTNSLLLAAGVGLSGYEVYKSYSILESLFVILPWLQRYYSKEIIRAESFAETRRRIRRVETFHQVINIVEKSNN